MRLLTASSLAACLPAVARAFTDTSPFFLWSTRELSKPSAFEPLQTSTKLLSNVRSYLEGCPTKTYLVVLQPGLSTADLSSSSSSDSGCAAVPRLCEGQRAEKVRTKLEVAEVVVAAGEDRKFEKSALELETYIRDLACKGRDGVEVKSLVLGALPARGTARQEALSDNDKKLGGQLDHLKDDYTVIYLSSPPEGDIELPPYEAQFEGDSAMRVELKRSVERTVQIRQDNATVPVAGSLFDQYQFFTSGIFMSLLVVLLLFTMLGVGIKGLSSLQVSYGAFEKDMGPAAQKKQ